MVDERVDLLRLVGVHHHALGLVRQQQMLILVHHRQPRLEQRQEHILLRGLVKELVVDVQLQHVALLQALVPLGAAAVDLHPLDADVLLRQRRRQQGQRLAQKPVQPRPGVVFSDGQLPHDGILPCVSLTIVSVF